MTNRSIIGQEIAAKLELPQKRGLEAAGVAFETIKASLAKGENVIIHGLGTFSLKSLAARERRNPKTGEKIQVAASTTVRFKPAKALKDALNPKRKVGGDRNTPAPLRNRNTRLAW